MMDKPMDDKGCLCGAMPGVTGLRVGDSTVGMMGLYEIFSRWKSENRSAEDLTDQEILQAVKARNYVPESAEADYVAAVRALYCTRK